MSNVDERGRITIDHAIREELGIRAGDETIQRIDEGRIVLEVIPGRHRRSLFGLLGPDVQRPAGESRDAIRDVPWERPDPDRHDR